MRCAWQEFLSVLPQWLRDPVDKQGRNTLQELRLRLGKPPEPVGTGQYGTWSRRITREDLSFVINMASRYSPWAAASLQQGFVTVQGGHRIGLCGEVRWTGEGIRIQKLSSICLRLARDFPGIGEKASHIPGNLLLIGPPGSGKTTLLRDLIRQKSDAGCFVCVVDERGELFPPGFDTGAHTDVLTGCPKPQGIEMLLKVMGPQCIAVDEITSQGDCQALSETAACGVEVLATAHASGIRDLQQRPLYRHLLSSRIFNTVLILDRDKSWHAERIGVYQ